MMQKAHDQQRHYEQEYQERQFGFFWISLALAVLTLIAAFFSLFSFQWAIFAIGIFSGLAQLIQVCLQRKTKPEKRNPSNEAYRNMTRKSNGQ